jgi:hypothetical protein
MKIAKAESFLISVESCKKKKKQPFREVVTIVCDLQFVSIRGFSSLPACTKQGSPRMSSTERREASPASRSVSGRWQADADVCAKIEKFHAYWQALSAARRAPPARRDFDPVAIPDLLPNLLLVEATENGSGDNLCRRVRLAGACIVAALGSEIAGYDLDSLPREDGARALAFGVDRCLAQQRPVPGEFTVVSGSPEGSARAGDRIAGFRFLAVPFVEYKAMPTAALVLVVFVAADGSEVRAEWLGSPAAA